MWCASLVGGLCVYGPFCVCGLALCLCGVVCGGSFVVVRVSRSCVWFVCRSCVVGLYVCRWCVCGGIGVSACVVCMVGVWLVCMVSVCGVVSDIFKSLFKNWSWAQRVPPTLKL